jgi:CRISPR/Cas system CSM-associated protein Csm3 (group 7 of RAMP superfamily)
VADITLVITLESDTLPGSGQGIAGLIDIDVRHDDSGLPYLHGRTVKGLLRAALSDLDEMPGVPDAALKPAFEMLGKPEQPGTLHIGPATTGSDNLRAHLKNAKISPQVALQALTRLRRQTKIDEETGAAEDHTLRTLRVLSAGLEMRAALQQPDPFTDAQKGVMAALACALRRIGTRRTRGLGCVRARLHDGTSDVTDQWLTHFAGGSPQ